MSAKYHINPETGESNICSAKIKCKFKITEEEHYHTKEEAQKAYEEKNRNNSILTLQKESNKDGELSAEMSETYAKWSLIHKHLHCGTEIGNEAELFYYSSPAGQLELQRRMESENRDLRSHPHIDIYDKLQEYTPKLDLSETEEKQFQEYIDMGTEKFKESNLSSKIQFDMYDRVDRDIGAHLIQHSSNWLTKLTPEQQEVISQSTSSGFYLVEQSMNLSEITPESAIVLKESEEVRKLNEAVKNSYTDEEYEENREKLNSHISNESLKFTQTLRDAVSLAPKLEEPIKVYRGMKIKEFDTMFDTTQENRIEIVQKLINGDYNGQTLNRKNKDGGSSKLSHAPISTTANPLRALSFSEKNYVLDNNGEKHEHEFIYEIESQTIASPVAVSAWGAGEAEIFTNHNSDYQIVEVFQQQERRSNITVIKLKEIIND